MRSLTVRIVDSDGSDVCVLPHYASLQLTVLKSAVGSVQLSYPRIALNSSEIFKGVEIRALRGGVEPRNGRWVLEDNDDDDASEDGKGYAVNWTGRTLDSVLERGILLPKGFSSGDYYTTTTPDWQFNAFTPGSAMLAAVNPVVGRGGFSTLDFSTFDDTYDSNGVAWPSTFSKTYSAGTTCLALLLDLVDMGYVDYEMSGRRLKLYVGGTMGEDLTLGESPVVLRKGRDLTAAPRQGTVQGTATYVVMQGSSHFVDYEDTIAAATLDRRETLVTEGNADDETTLRHLAQREVNSSNKAAEELSEDLDLSNVQTPVPWQDFYLGDWIWVSQGQGLEKFQVQQFVVGADSNNLKTGSVVLGTLLQALSVRLAQRIARLEAGNATGGSPVDPEGPGYATPNPPASVTASSDSFVDSSGDNVVELVVSWTAVTTNTDSSPVSNMYGYVVGWRYQGESKWRTKTVTGGALSTSFSPVDANSIVETRVAALETNGHQSTWKTGPKIRTATDTVAPNQPSTPTVDSSTFPMLARVVWDGKDAAGAAMPPDFGRAEAYVSNAGASFVPDSTTLVGSTTSPMKTVFDADVSAGGTYWAKIVVYDLAGNKSTPSAASASFGTRQLVDTDAIDAFVTRRLMGSKVVQQAAIDDLAVGTAQMIDLAVTNAKIGNLSVNDAKISDLSVSKLTTGTLSADLVVGARIKTANSGLRSEMNSSGFFHYNSSGAVVFSASGGAVVMNNATLSGTFSTDGTPVYVEMPASGDRIIFHDTSTGTDVEIGTILGEPSGSTSGHSSIWFTNGRGTTIFQYFDDGPVLWLGPGPPGTFTAFNADGSIDLSGVLRLNARDLHTGGGNVDLGSIGNLNNVNSMNVAPAINASPLMIYSDSATHRGLIVENNSGQTANIFEHQGSSGSNVLAKIDHNGAVYGTGAYTNLSDRSAKTDVEYLGREGALAVLMKLKPAKFNRKHTEGPCDCHAPELGFIAQDVKRHLPEAVRVWDHHGHDEVKFVGTKHERRSSRKPNLKLLGLQDGAIVAHLVLAVQELTDKVERLEKAR